MKIKFTNNQDTVLRALQKHPDGTWYNSLVRDLNGILSHVTIDNTLKELTGLKVVSKCPINPRKGKKVVYQLDENYQLLQNKLEELQEQSKLLIGEIGKLEFLLENNLLKDNLLITEFSVQLMAQYFVTYLLAEELCKPFSEKFQIIFQTKASNIVNNIQRFYFERISKYAEVIKFITFYDPKIFDGFVNHYDEYLFWLKKRDEMEYKEFYNFSINQEMRERVNE